MPIEKKSLTVLSLTLILLLLLAGGVIISLTNGSWEISSSRVIDILLSQCGLGGKPSPVEIAIIWDGRLPRVLTAMPCSRA